MVSCLSHHHHHHHHHQDKAILFVEGEQLNEGKQLAVPKGFVAIYLRNEEQHYNIRYVVRNRFLTSDIFEDLMNKKLEKMQEEEDPYLDVKINGPIEFSFKDSRELKKLIAQLSVFY